jgi:hypothetical protein
MPGPYAAAGSSYATAQAPHAAAALAYARLVASYAKLVAPYAEALSAYAKTDSAYGKTDFADVIWTCARVGFPIVAAGGPAEADFPGPAHLAGDRRSAATDGAKRRGFCRWRGLKRLLDRADALGVTTNGNAVVA